MLAKLIKEVRGQGEALSRIGGLPTHIPEDVPWKGEEWEEWGFLLQLWGTDIPGCPEEVMCIQVYQQWEEGTEPLPELVVLKHDAKPIDDYADIHDHPDISEFRIEFEDRDEPQDLDVLADENSHVFDSKLGGLDPWKCGPKGAVFVGQITESTGGFIFGGVDLVIYLVDGKFITRMA